MATQEVIRGGEVSLSAFECRCLWRQLCDCQEVVARAIAGTGAAQDRAPWLGPVCDALRAAEAEISKAGELVVADETVASACFHRNGGVHGHGR